MLSTQRDTLGPRSRLNLSLLTLHTLKTHTVARQAFVENAQFGLVVCDSHETRRGKNRQTDYRYGNWHAPPSIPVLSCSVRRPIPSPAVVVEMLGHRGRGSPKTPALFCCCGLNVRCRFPQKYCPSGIVRSSHELRILRAGLKQCRANTMVYRETSPLLCVDASWSTAQKLANRKV